MQRGPTGRRRGTRVLRQSLLVVGGGVEGGEQMTGR